MASRDLTVKFLGDSKGLQRAAKEAISSLDGTETKAQAVARALTKMAEKSEAEMKDAASAADVLGAAIGDEMRAEIDQAGMSIDQYVADLQRAGLTYDEIRADADALGDALVKMSAQGKAAGDDIKAGADQAQTGLDNVRTSGDNSRSVLANMVGNSAQDLGALGGVAGTAGMAIGQLAEYATEGNISLKGLAGVAGPMLGVTAAVFAISAVMKELGERSKKVTEQTEKLVKVQEDLADGRFEEAAASLAEEYIGTVAAAEEFGFTVDDVVGQLTGQADMMPRLNSLVAEYEEKARNGDAADLERLETLYRLSENLGIATEAYGAAGEKIATTAEVTDKLEGALRKNAAAADGTAKSYDGVDRSARDFADEIDRAEQAVTDMDEALRELQGNLDDRAAWRNLKESLDELQEAVADGETSWMELGEATDGVVADTARYIETLDGVDTEVKTELYTMLDEGALNEVLLIVDDLKKGLDVPVRLTGMGSGQAGGMPPYPGGRDGNPITPYPMAEGGIVMPRPGGTPAIIGEAGRPEAVIPLDRAGNMLQGSSGNTVNVTINTAADPNAVVDAIRRWQRFNGPL